jgi:hypothetical protein
VFTRRARQIPGRNRGRVRQGLAQALDNRPDDFVQARPDDFGIVSAAEFFGRPPGGLEFVVGGFAEADGRRDQPVAEGLGHVGHDEPRIDPAAEERAERHLALEARVDSRTQSLVGVLDDL